MSGHSVVLAEAAKKGLICSECDLTLHQAVQTANGDRMCFNCFESIKKTKNFRSAKTGISILNDKGQPECFEDRAVRRQVLQLIVKCKYYTYGCPWNGQLNDHKKHEEACRFQPQRCPNSHLGCTAVLSSDEVLTHTKEECAYRPVKCRHCGQEMLAKDEEEHFSMCPNAPVLCEHCSESMPRNELGDHQTNHCTTVICTCTKKLSREGSPDDNATMAAHAKEPAVLLQHIISLFWFVSKTFNNFQLRLESLESNGRPALPHLQDLAAIREEMEVKLKLMSERVVPLEKYTSIAEEITKLKIFVEQLKTRNKLLEDSAKTHDQQLRTLQTSLQHQSPHTSMGSDETNSIMKKLTDNERQLASLRVHVSELELQLQASLASTHNGSFLWRIPDMSRRRREAQEGKITSIYSPPFYTGRNGYKMCIRAYLNGDGQGYSTHLSLFFVIMRGEYDPLLKWPFDYKVSLILVDQTHRKHIVNTFKPTPDSSSFKMPETEMNIASGCPTFCKLSHLDDKCYVNAEDVVFIKCIVDTSRIFHP